MKTKHALIASLAAIPAAAVLRIFQYFFIIDQNGYFDTATVLGKALSWSLYGIYALAALAAVGLLLTGHKGAVSYKRAADCNSIRIGFLAIAAVILLDSGIRIGAMMSPIPAAFDWTAVLGLPAAVFFVIQLFSSRTNVISAITGIFPPIYICSRGIVEFFASFEKVHVSESKLEIFAICALALFTVTVCAMHVGVSISEKRIAAMSLLVCTFAAPTSIARIVAIAASQLATEDMLGDISWAAVQLLFIVTAVIILIRLVYVAEPVNEQPISDKFSDEFNIYIDEIPEEGNEND